MKPYPHHYQVAASAGVEGEVLLASAGLEPINTAPPVEFDGPGNRWSPETLLVGAIADCFILTFRAVARGCAHPGAAPPEHAGRLAHPLPLQPRVDGRR